MFGLILLIYAIIAEVFTVLFRIAGLTEERARFQVVSLLTNSGFTTNESEMIVTNPRRRTLARKTMLFGYAFSVSIVSAIVNIVLSLKLAEIEDLLWASPIPVLALGAVFVIRRNRSVKDWFNREVEGIAGQVLARSHGNRMMLMDSYGKHSVMAQVHLEAMPAALRGVALRDTSLSRDGITVILIKRKGSEVIHADADTLLMEDDQLVVFGNDEAIEKAFEIGNDG